MRKTAEKNNDKSSIYKNIAKIHIGGKTVEVDIEALAKVIAVNHADWKAYTGRAERVAQALPEILKCCVVENDLFKPKESL
jgi:hypothetical protein